MTKRNKAKLTLFVIATVLAMDTEPPLAVAVALLGIAGLLKD